MEGTMTSWKVLECVSGKSNKRLVNSQVFFAMLLNQQNKCSSYTETEQQQKQQQLSVWERYY